MRAANPGTGGSPVALEATLASISDEVTAEAVERRAAAILERDGISKAALTPDPLKR